MENMAFSLAFAFILHKYPGILRYLSLTMLNFFDYNNILITIKKDVVPDLSTAQ